MSHYNQNQQPQVAYPPPPPSSSTAYQAASVEGPYVVPPPVGYPMREGRHEPDQNHNSTPSNTQSRGDGFWKGCCAALCCCCLLDACF